ncbi:exodeoxyribonuclease VII small subunit [Marinisporobacter balticus]|uniref:Exodeoxyribonuclease 7 small subunit n=1 Tax=Marinisporobacter balticus TaxID=2018667 RepID=A0A4R2L1W8_9FIRM|nr:exodeoxyribonuclease VII small subunit [Marinisporobacter balticus]TCO79197.1 exodeoxyribonuclease VII small subunit [Marinisporobacter balticus]
MNTSKNITQKSNDSFEEAIKKLEEIVILLDEGKLTLDATLSLYEEGIRLYRACNNKLDQTEQKINILINNEEVTFHSGDLDN